MITVTDVGGTFNGSAYPATATIAGVGGSPSSMLEGVGLTVTYFSGSSASGTSLSGAPLSLGTYTAVASFPGSTDYSSGSSQTTFSIANDRLGIFQETQATVGSSFIFTVAAEYADGSIDSAFSGSISLSLANNPSGASLDGNVDANGCEWPGDIRQS